MTSARHACPSLLGAIVAISLVSFSVSTVLGESRGESHRPDDNAPKSKTEVRHEVKTRSDGVQIRISVRQETERREASSERREGGERRPGQTPPVVAPTAPSSQSAAPP